MSEFSEPEFNRVRATREKIHTRSHWAASSYRKAVEPGGWFPDYNAAGGTGGFIIGPDGEELWTTRNIEFDDQWFIDNGFAPPLVWADDLVVDKDESTELPW